MSLSHLLWRVGGALTRLGDLNARRVIRSRDSRWGGSRWTGR